MKVRTQEEKRKGEWNSRLFIISLVLRSFTRTKVKSLEDRSATREIGRIGGENVVELTRA